MLLYDLMMRGVWSFYFRVIVRTKNHIKALYHKVQSFIYWKREVNYCKQHNVIAATSIFTHMTSQEKLMLASLAANITRVKPVVVEIGSFLGASACFMASGIHKKDGVLYCIDTWKNHAMDDQERDTYNDFMHNTRYFKDTIVPMRGWSHEVIDVIKDHTRSIDLLFIDGDHSYDACLRDWLLYSPLLVPGSVVVFHDTGWSEGVKMVIRDHVLGNATLVAKLPNMQAYRIESLSNI